MKTNFSRVMATMALRFRDNLALVNVERDRRYSFAEYHRLTNRIAHMMRHALGLGAGDKVMLILENDNLSLLHFPAIFKQEATFVFSNLRDSQEEQARQIDHVRPKLLFIETRLVAEYRDMLAGRGCTIVARWTVRPIFRETWRASGTWWKRRPTPTMIASST
jgi:fatty-acyl-CoA synthase